MNSLEKNLCRRIEARGPLDFPGGRVQSYYRGKKIVDLSFGKTWPLYDLASLTKILFTTTVLMQLFENKKFRISDPVQKRLPWYPSRSVALKNLLNHTAGQIDWHPFYKGISRELPPVDRYEQLLRAIVIRPLRPDSLNSQYSDLDFFLLGSVLQELTHSSLKEVWKGYRDQFLPSSQLHFRDLGKKLSHTKNYGPTEYCSWRKKGIQGEVHDENAWALGGIAPHAGLFGTVSDLSHWALKIRDVYRGNFWGFSQRTLKLWVARSLSVKYGDWGLGFMKPSRNSTAGKYFSPESFGHTGFTGTSLWIDPKRDLIISLVSNRIHPSRKNKDFIKLRPEIHNWIVEGVEELK